MLISLRVLLVTAAIAEALFLAAPAAASPVFNSASVTPPAISPNGDDVNEVALITYDVALDSVDVRILLGPPGGGSVTDTLQVLTRTGRGIHVLAFDGTTGSGPVPDGSYEIRIYGSWTEGVATETRVLPFLIDRAPPVLTSLQLSPPGPGIFKNGDTVTLQACFDALPDTVRVDLSALDSGFNPAAVTTTTPSPGCLRFTYVISAGNTRADAADLPARVVAVDRAGNRHTGSLPLCLSNDPPQVSGTPTLLNESPFFQNGDEIQAQITFSAPGPLIVGGDFSNVDSGFDPGQVVTEALGGGVYHVRYRLSEDNTRPDGTYEIHLFALDAGCGAARDSTLQVTLDNAGLNSSLVEDLIVDPPAFSPSGNGQKQVAIRFTVLVDSLNISLSVQAILENPADTTNILIQRFTVYARGTYSVVWNGNGGPAIPSSRLVDQNMTVFLRAVSIQLDRQRTLSTGLEVDNVPPSLIAFPDPGEIVFHNGDVTSFFVQYDRSGYQIVADFSNIDSNWSPSSAAVRDDGGGNYRITYAVSANNAHSDATNLPLLLTAVDRAGNTAGPVNLVRGCLDNLPPRFLSASLVGSQGPFRNGSRIVVRTAWQTEPTQDPIRVTANFSALDDHFDPTKVTVVSQTGGVYEVAYTIAANNAIQSGSDLPILVTARDDPAKGCGETTVEAVRVDFDAVPSAKPTWDPSLETVSRTALYTVRGSAPDAIQVQILLEDAPVDTFPVEPLSGAFTGQVTLKPGSNVFTARGIDRAGNGSAVSAPFEVFFLQATVLRVPGRFGPGDQFFLALLERASAVTVRIFNLEGVEVKRLEQGAGEVYRIAWDGRDQSGALSASGPCIAVLEVHGDGGDVRERVRKAFVFTRQGVAAP